MNMPLNIEMLDLRAQAAAVQRDFNDLPSLTDAERTAALSTWRGRMLNEFVSARVFAKLARQAAAAGLHPTLIERATVFEEDECRHGYLCAAVVEALGGEAIAPIRPLDDVPDHADCGPLEGLLRNVMSISCLAETVAVSLISAERLESGPESLRDVLTEILADEVRHARFGWTLLDGVAAHVDESMKKRLGRYLQVAFNHLERHELRFLPQGEAPSSTAERVGVCDGDQSRALFYSTVTDVIIAGLEQRGYPARQAWDRRHQPLQPVGTSTVSRRSATAPAAC